jgi:hypothetical protein
MGLEVILGMESQDETTK